MIFRYFLKLNFILLSGIFLFGCSDFLKGKPAKQEILEIKSEDTQCLKDISPQFKKMIQSESTQNEIETVFKCLDQTLNQFQNRVEGKSNSEAFTAEDLFIIFDKFHKNAEISKQSVFELLNLKKALLGGTESEITKTEISDLRVFLKVIKQEMHNLLPHMKIFALNKESGLFSKLQIDSGFSQLRSSLKILLSSTKLEKSDYEFNDLKKLLNHLKLIQNEQKELFELVEKVKLLLIGTANLRNRSDYELAIDNFLDLMTNSAYIVYGDIQFEIKSETQLSKVVHFVDSMVSILINSVQFQKNSFIQTSSLDGLIEAVLQKNMLPFQVQSSTFKSFYKKIIIKVFSDQKNISIDSLDSIKLVHLKSIQKEVAIFKLGMDFINSNQFQNDLERKKISDLQSKAKNYNPGSKIKLWSHFNTDDQQDIMNGFLDLNAELMSTRPITYRFKKMVLAVNQDIWDMSWEDLARVLYGKMLARNLLRGWGDSKTVTESGFIEWYSDFKLFAIETKTFDPRSDNTKTGKETFLQANLFTFDGNGDQSLNISEAFQYVNMLMSGGGQSFQEIREGLAIAGCNLKEKDAFGYPWNDEVCFYQNFKKNYKFYFSNLSYLVAYLNKLSDTEFKNYYESLMVVARFDAKAAGRIESADIRVLSMTLMYIESLFSVYDKNNNWTLSPAEIRFAFPRFRNFVTDYAHKNAKAELNEWDVIINPCRPIFPLDSFISEAFIFLAYNGRLPQKSDVNDPSTFSNIYECGKYQLGLDSSYQPFAFKGEIDRKSIINTFKVLKSALESK